MIKVHKSIGEKLMVLWGVQDWTDPGAEYFIWDTCCIFAIVNQGRFLDIHMAMDKSRWRDCRTAGAEILKLFGNIKLRAVILTDRPHVCNFARKMGFGRQRIETLTTTSGRESAFFIMWREPGEYHGRSN